MAILPWGERGKRVRSRPVIRIMPAIIGPNRKMSDTFARSVMDRVDDRSDRAYAHDFTNTFRTKRIHSLVGLIDNRLSGRIFDGFACSWCQAGLYSS